MSDIAVLTPAYSALAVRAAEQPLLEAGEPLMARAAAATDACVRDLLEASVEPAGPVLVLAGTGNNGGDALFAAASLAASGVRVDLLLTSDRAHSEGLGAARRAGTRCVGLDDVRAGAAGYRVIVDGILGIGTSAAPALRGIARAAVETLIPAVRSGAPDRPRVVAVDLPSGLHPDDGSADDAVLPADVTVTFGALKAGLVRGRGPEFAGAIRLVDLGLGPALARVRPELETSVPVRLVA
ncbi:MAG: NAD(P)H-hydrate epimerase [Microbacterium sp.]|uniref:NAD(P)H-hydrate epimerase n=1 Tax=Microbacterium sp. TaxID=51671 RepID=UPI002717B815|nr:NAD(P)H-hydrate epimerase [Microbacterium sp.]MDO8384127.1 NAD(P)H-hydrate epimerase [Microbacterium sp.]